MERVEYESVLIQDLLMFQSDGSLDTNPWYQRRSVWSEPQRSYLINTILEGKPVPSIYIRHTIDLDRERSLKEVVDGQQRIKAIMSYRNDDFAARHPRYSGKILFSQMTAKDKKSFLSTSLSVGYLIGADDQDVIDIFGRINSVAKTLNPQEKRNARNSGEFKQFCLRQAIQRLPFWRAARIFTASNIARMQEVQFVSDLVINMIEGLSDFSAKNIDNYYTIYDVNFPQETDIEERFDRLFSILLSISIAKFCDTIFSTSQILFSLMIIMDSERNIKLSADRIQVAIDDVNDEVLTYADLESEEELQAEVLYQPTELLTQ